MSEKLVVGIDVGTSGLKAIALSESGAVVARAERSYPLSTPQPGWSEQDPDHWVSAARDVLAELPDPVGLGFSGQMHGLVSLDANDNVIRPAILWNDGRTTAECREIEATIGLDRLIELTGNRALEGYTAPKLLWLRRHEPESYARIESILLPKDYVRLKLLGERAIDVADASGTLLLDVANRRWSDEVTDALEIPTGWLPPVHESPDIAGAGDQAAAAVGVGVIEVGPLSVVLGTSGVVFSTLPAYAADPGARTHTFCHALPGVWHAMGVMLSAAGSLSWLQGIVGGSFDHLVAEAERWEPGVEGLTFLPYLVGERTPHANPDARAAFAGLSVRHDRGALVRAVLEGVAYGLRDILELLRDLGVEPTVGRVSGGGSRSDLWLNIVASVLGVPLERMENEDGSAFGAALLAGVRTGLFGSVEEAVATCVRARETIEPNPEWSSVYDSGYDHFRTLYPALHSN
ncbi:MAG: xylulokinase [Gaiellaceae bacterium]|nr:xylulokinase [Gaiellaceae bacterium]